MADQLSMQKEDYVFAMKKGAVFVCKECNALSIETCDDVKKGECFYCGSKKVSRNKKLIEASFDEKVASGSL